MNDVYGNPSWYQNAMQRMVDQFLHKKPNASSLKSEYIQMSHHGQNGPDKTFYDAIDAKNSKRIWPTPEWLWNTYNGTYKTDMTN